MKIFFLIINAYLRNMGRVVQNNIAEKYYNIGRSKLCWDISGLDKDGLDIQGFDTINYIITHHD